MKRFILCFLFFLLTQPVAAISDPLTVPNNRYGIHIADLNDIPDVAPLVNSNGGDWGYVTLVAPQTDMNTQSWQKLFDQMRRLHLIPIVRLATKLEGASWIKPKKETIRDWASFLTSLNWPTENRYVVLFNEPNHANEWGNTLDPEGYADTLVSYAQALKKASEDFFILPAALDASAATDGTALDESEFMQRMLAAKPELLDVIDGWTSHAYPNPGFSGSPYAWGRGSLRTFDWELGMLRQLGLKKQLPVFITETGWVHREGKFFQPGLLSSETVGANLAIAAAMVWTDARIAAVTPFVFNYQDVPFDHFSFKKLGEDGFYPQNDAYRLLPKIHGQPKQRESFELRHPVLPAKLITNSRYTFTAELKNTGQGILDPAGDYRLTAHAGNTRFTVSDVSLPYLEPGQHAKLLFSLETPSMGDTYHVELDIMHHDTSILLESQQIRLTPPPSATIHSRLGWRRSDTANDVKVLIYQSATLIHEFPHLRLVGGSVTVSGLTNIVPGQPYRIVLVIPYYLPRQRIQTLPEETTSIDIGRMLPLDADGDGALTPNDIRLLLQMSPFAFLSRFFGP